MIRLSNVRNVPIFRFIVIFAVGFLLAIFAVSIALQQTNLSVSPEVGDTLQTANQQFVLTELDFTPEPGEIENNVELAKFFERQSELSKLLSDSSLTITKNNQQENQAVSTSNYSIKNLHFLFWLQVAIGFVAILITGWVWALRSGIIENRLFVLGGVSIVFMTFSAAIYSTRELALSPLLFKSLWMVNAFASSIFGITLIALLLVYPSKLNHWRRLMVIQTIFFLVWTFIFSWGLLPVWANVNLLLIIQVLVVVLLVAAQFLATAKNPTARASLTWLGLSILVGTGAFIALNTIPVLFGLKAMEQSHAFLFILVLYGGLAAGIRRYRLFEVGEWAFRFFFYALGVVLFVLLDAGFIYLLGIDRFPALGLGLIAIGFLYLPLREVLWNKFSKYTPLTAHELLEEILFVAMATPSSIGAERWKKLLQKLYDPLEIKQAETSVTEVQIESDGLVLIVPAVAGALALKLSYPFKGRSLYTLQSRGLAIQMVSLIKRAESSLKEMKK